MTARRIALLIGINRYPNLQPSFTLTGCINDQTRLKTLLAERFDFGNQIKTLFDEQATRDAILDALDRLAGLGKYEGRSPLQSDDVVFIGYSGHGSRIKEPENRRDEPDGYDSTIIPFDTDRAKPTGKGGPNRDITDDELRLRFERISEKAGHLVLYFDCCHSGTISRDLEGETDSRTIPDAESGYDDVERLTAQPAAGSRSLDERPASGWLPLAREKYLLIAGAADDEKARELSGADGKRYGALSHYLTNALEQVNGVITYLDLFERARPLVTARFPQQHPQIEGSPEQHLFGLTAEQLTPAARVESRLDDQRLRLTAGRMHGVRVGWRFDIRPLALAETETLATVEVTSVGEATCEVKSDEPLPASVTTGCRAIATHRPMGDEALPVAISAEDEALASRLDALIKFDARCRLVPLKEAALAAVLLPVRAHPTEDDLAAELGPLAAPTWVLVGGDRRLYGATPQPANAVGVVAEQIAAWAGAWLAARYQPPSGTRLAGRAARLRVLGYRADGNHVELPTDPKSGMVQVKAGDPIVIEMTNRSPKPLWMTLLDVGLMGSVSIAYPPNNEQLGPGPFRLGEDGGIHFSIPTGFPDALAGGRETLKLVLSEQETDFSLLLQEGAREINILRSTLPDTAWDAASVDLWVER